MVFNRGLWKVFSYFSIAAAVVDAVDTGQTLLCLQLACKASTQTHHYHP